MKRMLLTLAVSLTIAAPAQADCNSKACEKRVYTKHRKKAIKPFVPWLRTTGACESGTTRHLRHGLRAISPGGTYRGRYQFDMSSWSRAGGKGDPARAGWLEQAYRAVKWRKLVGAGAWPVCGH